MKNDKYARLRSMCRGYLKQLRYIAKKRGLLSWVDETIELTRQEDCKPTQHEVEMLARCVDDERLNRIDIPNVLGKSYRECVEDEDFEKIKKLHRVGVYSKISAMLHVKTSKK